MPHSMDSSSNTVIFLFLWMLTLLSVDLCICRGSSEVLCIPIEREALLKVKLHLQDPSNRLASWSGNGDCCNWASVDCSNVTGHILKLHLRTTFSFDEYEAYERSRFGGEIHPSMLDLKHLNYLDLSHNDFGGMQIPSFLGSMVSLTYLNLSYAGFSGSIPHQIGNLSNLLYLDLRRNDFTGSIPHQIGNLTNLLHLALEGAYKYNTDGLSLSVENLQWLSALSALQFLELTNVNVSNSFDWLQVLHSLPFLRELRCYWCDNFHHHFHPSTTNFSSLVDLDLSYSYDYFGASSIPKWIFQLKNLVSLRLHYNNLQGSIPDGIQNLTILEHLDLSYNLFNSSIPNWLYGFSHLKFLSLSWNNLDGTISNAIGNLTSLITLDLSYNQFEGQIPRSFKNLCNLRSVHFSNKKCNQTVSKILEILSGCVSHRLESLSIIDSQLLGHLTDQIGNFTNLVELDLSKNMIQGAVPESLGKLTSLKNLDLSNNKFNGNPFEILRPLSKLEVLVLNHNLFEGTVNKAHFASFTSLFYFSASRNQLNLTVDPDWSPPFQHMTYLGMASWYLGPKFPSWLQSLKYLGNLDISNTWISDSIPTWIWTSYPHAFYFDLSHNDIHGELSNALKNFNVSYIDLSSNHLSGQLPYNLSPDVLFLNLSSNWLSGSITEFLCQKQEQSKGLEYLHVASNNLSGEIPDCWKMWPYLVTLNLQNNHLIGTLPPSMGSLAWLKSLQLRNNKLLGEFPVILKNISSLISLDLRENQFSGSIPSWVGQNLMNLKILLLRSNKFLGPIPDEICSLNYLQILDLAQNNLTGHIPKCVNHLRAMLVNNNSLDSLIYCSGRNSTKSSIVDVLLKVKGRDVEYSTILGLVTSIDLSVNKLSGDIPKEITSLMGLHFLNLSNNYLSSQIPHGIGNMRSLLSMDFSRNQLCAEIPRSISDLSLLNSLDLSFNNLKGKIPTGTQLQSFEASSFVGNHLCGPPLTINCTSNVVVLDHNGKEGDGDRINWFDVSVVLGFMVGFGVVVGPLLYQRSWRYTYFQFLDDMWYKLRYCWC